MAKSGDFFAKIFRYKDDEHYLNIFTLPARKSTYYQNPDEIPTGKFTQKQDYYYGLCTLLEPSKTGRTKEIDTAGVTCLWMDVDDSKYSGDAPGILNSLDIAPSFCVESGGGLHAYWLLDKYVYFETQADRVWFKRIIQGWQSEVNKSFGSRLDHTHDLARILRIPGTLNHKYNPARPVKIAVGATYAEYPIQIFEGYMAPAEGKVQKTAVREISTIQILKPGAMSKQINAAIANTENFGPTYYRQRPDLEDQSPSGYDFSLGIQCAQLGWSEEEIVNTLIEARRDANEDIKAHRLESYWKVTLQAIYGRLKGTQKEPAYIPPTDNPEKNREFLSDKLGLSVSALIKHGSDDSLYKLKLSDDRIIDIGPIKMLASMTSFRNRIFDAAGIYLRKLNQKNWPDILDALNSITVLEQHEDEDEIAQWINWVAKYFGNINVGKEAGLPYGKPYIENGCYYLSIGSFVDWLRINLHVKPGKYETSAILKQMGFFRERVRASVENTDGEFETVRRSVFSISVQRFNALQGRGEDTPETMLATSGAPIGKN